MTPRSSGEAVLLSARTPMLSGACLLGLFPTGQANGDEFAASPHFQPLRHADLNVPTSACSQRSCSATLGLRRSGSLTASACC